MSNSAREVGKIASLVLLEANPLQNIRNTQRIAAVVVNGKYLPKASLQKMLADAAATAKKYADILCLLHIRMVSLVWFRLFFRRNKSDPRNHTKSHQTTLVSASCDFVDRSSLVNALSQEIGRDPHPAWFLNLREIG